MLVTLTAPVTGNTEMFTTSMECFTSRLAVKVSYVDQVEKRGLLCSQEHSSLDHRDLVIDCHHHHVIIQDNSEVHTE